MTALPPYGQPHEGIAVTTRYFALSWLFAAVKPKILVNGYEMPVWGWGRTVLPLTAGQYLVHVYVPYFFPRRVGPADYTVAVNPWQIVELKYQRYNGVGVTVAIMAAAVLLMIIWMVVVVAMSR
jgi:hypothetical protein